jgi:hypothetical protein
MCEIKSARWRDVGNGCEAESAKVRKDKGQLARMVLAFFYECHHHCGLLKTTSKSFSHMKAIKAALLFLKAAGYLQESSYSREPFP